MSDQRLGGDVGHRPSPASKPHSSPRWGAGGNPEQGEWAKDASAQTRIGEALILVDRVGFGAYNERFTRAERSQLRDDFAALVEQVETLRQLNDRVIAERDSWERECNGLSEQLRTVEQQRDLAQREAEMYKADRDGYDALLGHKMAQRDGCMAKAEELQEQLETLQRQKAEALDAVVRHMNEVRGARQHLQAIVRSYDPARAEESARVMYDIARSTPKRDERGRLLDPEWAERVIERWSPGSTPAMRQEEDA